jgi:phage gp46-like protein
MPDVRIVSTADLRETVADWLLLPNGNLDQRDELANYCKVALMSDALSDVGEELPDPDSDDRRGWWGDMQADVIWQGWPIGTKNWLLSRAKIADVHSAQGDTVSRAENYTRNALLPLIAMKLCSNIDVTATRVGVERIDVRVVVYRGPTPEVSLVFQDLWNQMRIETPSNPYGYNP